MRERLGDKPREYQTWTFRSRGRDLPVWDVPGDDPDGPVVIFSHGWGDSRIGALTRAPAFLPLTSRLIMWDMPGHGEAPGRCTLGTHEAHDLLALVERVSDARRGVVLFGWSLGAVVSIRAAARAGAQVHAVIAEGPYRLAQTPARNVMRLRGLPWKWNVGAVFAIVGLDFGVGVRWRGFDVAEHAARLSCPLLVIHGAEDSVCPVEDGREIAAAAKQGAFVAVEGGQHFGLWTEAPGKDVCAAAVRDLLGRVGKGGSV